MATDDTPSLWMLSGTGDRGMSESHFSFTARYTRADHPEDIKVEWDYPSPDDTLPEGQARLTVTGWNQNAVFREYKRLWAERYAEAERARRSLLAAQSAARKDARPARTWRRSGW